MDDAFLERGVAGMMDDVDMDVGMGDDPRETDGFHDESPLFAKLMGQTTLGNFEKVARGIPTKDKDQLFIARKALSVYIGRRDWGHVDNEVELGVLLRLSDRYGAKMVGLDVIETLLGNSSMVFNYSAPLLDLIERGRKIMRSDREKEPDFNASSPVAKIVEQENARFERFCRALVQWNNRLVPNYEPYKFEEHGRNLTSVEKMYQAFRGKKDLVLCVIVHWRTIFSNLGRVRGATMELYRWISIIHLESVCVANPVNALRCVSAFSQVTDLFPGLVVDLFRECLLECVAHSHPPQILESIFPCAIRDEYDNNLVIDDPVRDLAILSLLDDDRAGRYEELITESAAMGIVARQEIFSQTPTKFIPIERRYIYNQDGMGEWHRETIRLIFFKLMILFTRSEQNGVWALHKEGIRVTLHDLFQSAEPELWCVFVCWWVQYRGFYEHKKGKQDEDCQALVTMVMESFTAFGESLKTRQVTIGTLRQCNIAGPLHFALDFLGYPETGPLCASYEEEIRATSNKLQNMSHICKRFFPADPCLEIVSDSLGRWSSLQLAEVSYLFRQIDTVRSSEKPPGPLPETLVESLDWVLYVMNSRLFGSIWEGVDAGEPRLPKLEIVRREWESLYLSIVEQSITFPCLQVMTPFLQEGGDLECLYCSTTSSPQDAQLHWGIRPVDRVTLEKVSVAVKKFSHLQGCVENLPIIEECLPLFEKWIKDVASLKVFQDHVDAIKSTLESHPWDRQTLKDYSKFSENCEALHPSLLKIRPSLFEKVFECLDLLEWLATQPDDTDFTRGIEMAMGRGEMECPPELWLEEEGQAGRVNEQILSMLQSVRSYLHRFIFRKQSVFPTADDFISQFLAHLSPFDKSILTNMETCSEYRLALQELLGGGNENAAPDRLLRMLQRSSDARWVCDSLMQTSVQQAQLVIDDFLRLEYKTHGRKKEIVIRSLSVSEVEDFQSSVVLARTDQRGEDTQEKIRNFVQSFGWMKQYSTHLLTLNSLGHFYYDSFSESLPLTTDAELIRKKALNAKQILANWETMVRSARFKYPCLNYFGMKLVWEIAKFLRDQATKGFSPDARPNLIQKTLYLVNPALSEQSDLVGRVEKDLLSKWSSLTQDIQKNDVPEDEDEEMFGGGLREAMPEVDGSKVTEKKLELEELLGCCGQTIQEVVSKLPLSRCKVDLPEGNFSLSLKRGDFRLIMARSYEHVFHEIFSSFLQTYCLPERRTLFVCRENSSWEDVHMLLLRWISSTKEDNLFALGCCDLLSNGVQVKCVGFIQDHQEKASAPLLLICGPSKGSYIVSQFLSRRIPSYPLSRTLLQGLVEKHYHKKFQTFASDYAGAGKTYQIRKGSSRGEKYVHVPATSIKQFLTLLNSLLSGEPNEAMASDPAFFGDTPLLLHFDVYDTVGAELNSYLFEIIFFGGFCDFMNGVIFLYPLSQTFVSIELPTGPLSRHLVVPQLCPVNLVVAEAALFARSKKDLICGLGLHTFYGVRYDGTALRKREQNVRHANAYDRLQYVCFALDLLRRNNGRFPYVFDCNVTEPEGLLESLRISASADLEVADTDISGDLCFDLLVRASGLPRGKVSLWCLWNFVNMVYWQIRDMHFQGSPLNELCMPQDESVKEGDEKKALNKKESNESKKLVKGEVLAFILRTAREFAIRQTNEIDPMELVGLDVKGFSRHDFNGTWTKEIYEHDGQPVFTTKGYKSMTFFMYYRAKEEGWVIDDLIASEGPSFSHTEKSKTYEAVWKTCASWQPDLNIKCAKVRERKAYQGEAYEIKGFPTKDENGTYHRQPPYDDINNQPHYIKTQGTRRHLFYSEREAMWQICPVCTDDEGAFGIAQSLASRWSVMPDDIVEKSVKFVSKKHGGPSAKPKEQEEVESFFFDEAEELMIRKDEDFNEFLKLERLFEKTKRWADSNHECLLFSNVNHIISFLSMNPKIMKKEMHPTLMEFLKGNQVNIGESLDQLSARHHEILGALTEVYREAEEAKNVGGGNYCLTGDNLLKMLAIFIRLRVGIPVILMGECGCGKTALLNYLCTWLGVDLLVLDVHGGTTADDILEVFATADKNRMVAKKPQYIFLDEVNACSHMGLICEVITRRSLNGNPIHDQIHILAALNPYRRRPPQAETFGLVYKHKKGSVMPLVQDEMSNLVYRVTPIPASLRDFVFDFGSLEQDQERLYVRSMVCSMLQLPNLDGLEHKEAQIQKKRRENDLEIITELVVESQSFVRIKEGDPSCVSLRDVKRFLFFVNFFMGMGVYSSQVLVTSVVVSLALVYYYRLSREGHRRSYWGRVCDTNCLRRNGETSSFQWPVKQREVYKTLSAYFGAILKKTQNEFCCHLEIEEGIAKNGALTENLFVTIVCILNRVPVFLVGKPGTSKTLTLQIIASNLQGNQSPNKFWRKYPSVYVFPYQCSPMSDSQSIQHQFNMAVRYQEHANNTITVLLLDEVGLAEHSPDMPLKCLHGMLVDPPIAIVGLSNWVLDPAKMNRAVLVQRPEPSHDDICQTGSSIMGLPPDSSLSPLVSLLEKVSRAYFKVYTNQAGRDFIGMRDYYSLVKSLRAELPKNVAQATSKIFSQDEVIFAVCRNFSGRDDILRDVLLTMCQMLYGSCDGNVKDMTLAMIEKQFHFQRPSLAMLIHSNLVSHSSRHLMLLTRNCAALSLLFSAGLVDRNSTKVIVGSEFTEDDTELFLVQQMNEVKLAMATGKVIVLMNADNMYEALYDVLNQRYLVKRDPKTNKVQRLLRLAIGSRSSLCHVEDGFRIIVVAEQDYAYRELDLPLLNRFEKQILTPSDVLGKASAGLTKELFVWVDKIMEETTLSSCQAVFCGYHDGTIPSLVFNLKKAMGKKAKSQDIVEEAKKCLKRIASPASVSLSPSLSAVGGDYHPNLLSVVDDAFKCTMRRPLASILMTFSPVTHLEDHVVESLNADVTLCRLDQVKSESSFKTLISNHLTSPKQSEHSRRLLLVQFDPIMCSSLQINHAKFLVTSAIETCRPKTTDRLAVLFLVHMPPGLRNRTRTFVLDFEMGWTSYFLDDIRGLVIPSNNQKLDLPSLLRTPLDGLFESGVVNFLDTVSSQLPGAVSRMKLPAPLEPRPLSFLEPADSILVKEAEEKLKYSNRIHAVKALLKIKPFADFFYDGVFSILKHHGGKEGTVKGLLLHTSLAIGEMSCGSLIQSVNRTISELTLQAIMYFLIYLEKNFTLGTLKFDTELWMLLAKNGNVVDVASLPLVSRLGGKDVMRQLQSKYPANTGKTGVVVSKFPFSYSIFNLLSGDSTRKAIESTIRGHKTGSERFELETAYMEKAFSGFFGERVSEIVLTRSKEKGCVDYFHDFVAMIAPPVDRLTFEEIEFLHKAIIQSFHPNALASPAAIHAAFRQNESKIQVVCSLLSTLPSAARNRILLAIHEASCDPSHKHRLLRVLEAVFEGISITVWDGALDLPFVVKKLGVPIRSGTKSYIPTLISTAEDDITDLISFWERAKQDFEKAYPDEPLQSSITPTMQWRSIRLLRIFLEGYEKDEVQWGMGEHAMKVIELLRLSDPCSPAFFNDFFAAIATFYSPLCCCVDCNRVIAHLNEPHATKATRCAVCEHGMRWIGTKKNDPKCHRPVGNLILPAVFWDNFLKTQVEREIQSSKPDKESSKSSKKDSSASSNSSGNLQAEEPEQQSWFGKLVGNLFHRKEKKEEKKESKFRRPRRRPTTSEKDKKKKTGDTPERQGEASASPPAPVTRNKPPKEPVYIPSEEEFRQSKALGNRYLDTTLIRYTNEILLSVNNPVSEIRQVNKVLLEHLSTFVNVHTPQLIPELSSLPENLQHFAQFEPAQSTRVALMHILLRAEEQANRVEDDEQQQRNPEVFFDITTTIGKRLFLAHCLSEYEEEIFAFGESAEALTRLIKFVSASDIDTVTTWLNEEPEGWGNSREHIQSLARIQVVLRWYGKRIGSDTFPSDELARAPEYVEFCAFFNNFLSGNHECQYYVLKNIKELGGFDSVLSWLFVCQKKGCSWIEFDAESLVVVMEDCPMGPLVPFENENAAGVVKDKLADCLNAPEDRAAFDALTKRSHLDKLLLPALYNEISQRSVRDRKSAEFLVNVIDLVNKLSEHFRKSGEGIVADLLPLACQAILLLNFSSLESDLLNKSLIPCGGEESGLTNKGKVLVQLQLRLLMGAIANPYSWLTDLIMVPERFLERYLPASRFETPLVGVRWYECPNGHPYSVGECGRPMQKGKCPACGAEIGGQHHLNVEGVKEAKNNPLMDFASHLGYSYTLNERIQRLSGSTAAFFRLIVDMCLFLSLHVPKGSPDKTGRLIRERDPKKVAPFFTRTLGGNLQEIIQIDRLDTMLAGVLINAVLCNFTGANSIQLWPSGSKFSSKDIVMSVENAVKAFLLKATRDIGNNIKHRVDSSWQASQREKILQRALGPKSWDALLEKNNNTEIDLMWKYSPPPTIDHFLRFASGSENFNARYPLLSAFLEEENRLQLVRCIVDILEWHRLLFMVFQNNEIDHGEAMNVTNEEAVERLSTEFQRDWGRSILHNYCKSFNASFPIVQNLFQCQENPFLKEGEVDLGGGGVMSPLTPISYSLPSISEGQKEKDAPALCTVQLLIRLHRVHEEALGLGREQPDRERRDGPQAAAKGDDPEIGLPEVSCETPSRILRQKLIMYNRGVDLLPLLSIYSARSKEGELVYELKDIEDSLRFGVLGGKQSTRLHVKYYQFRGDVRTSDQLGALRLRIPQVAVSNQTMQMIFNEVDTHNRITRLLGNLEVIVNFVTRIGGQQVKELGIGKTLVKEYALNTLQMDRSEWEEASTQSVNEHICLCHLSNVFMRLQEQTQGSLLDQVGDEYRLDMDESQKEEFQKVIEVDQEKFMGIVLPNLHNFLTNRLVGEQWDAELPLKDLLSYVIADNDDADWYDDHFPESLCLKYSISLFQFLSKMQ